MKKIIVILLVVLASLGLYACQDEEAFVTAITVSSQPTKSEYLKDEAFDPAGLVVKAVYSDGTEEVVPTADYTITGFSSAQAGVVTLTVTYLEKTVTFNVAVFDPEAPETLQSIRVVTPPTKQFYLPTETFNPAGLVVEATYSTGRKENLDDTDYDLSGFFTGVIGKYTVTVSYEGQVANFPAEVRAINVQGITDTEILIGNTATTEYIYTSFIGKPFNAGLNAALEEYNDAGGFGGKDVRLINYDDSFNGTIGLTNTRKLINEDKVFALVGHFGTPTVSATLSLIRETGIPMVYAATGVMGLYRESSPLDPVLPVQPIYLTDGRMMTARAINETLYGTAKDQALPAGAKIGVLYTNDDAGIGMKNGIEIEAKNNGKQADMIYKSFSTADIPSLTTAVGELRSAGVQAILIASNQAPTKAALGVLNTQAMTVPVFSSYVNADPTAVDVNETYGFDFYTNAWLDVTSEANADDLAEFALAINNASFLTAQEKNDYLVNAFAYAGYVAAKVFLVGLERVGTNELTWETYIKALESSPVDIPMGGFMDFSNGMRHGITDMSLLKYVVVEGDNPVTPTVETKYASFELERPIENIDVVSAK